MPDVYGVFQVQLFSQLGQVIGVGVHLIPIPGLTGTSMAAPVMRDTAIAVGRQEEHLCFPVVGSERPAVAEDDGLPLAPVFVIDFRAVFGLEGTHGGSPYLAER